MSGEKSELSSVCLLFTHHSPHSVLRSVILISNACDSEECDSLCVYVRAPGTLKGGEANRAHGAEFGNLIISI